MTADGWLVEIVVHCHNYCLSSSLELYIPCQVERKVQRCFYVYAFLTIARQKHAPESARKTAAIDGWRRLICALWAANIHTLAVGRHLDGREADRGSVAGVTVVVH